MYAALELTVDVTNEHVAGTCTTTDCLLIYTVISIVLKILILKISKLIDKRISYAHHP